MKVSHKELYPLQPCKEHLVCKVQQYVKSGLVASVPYWQLRNDIPYYLKQPSSCYHPPQLLTHLFEPQQDNGPIIQATVPMSVSCRIFSLGSANKDYSYFLIPLRSSTGLAILWLSNSLGRHWQNVLGGPSLIFSFVARNDLFIVKHSFWKC